MKKLAVIGCGGIGTYHLGHLVNFKDIELVGFCDLIKERAEKFVATAGCGKAFTDFEQMYDETKPDMVFICIPPTCHGYVELETIRRGIHFFVEKPVALDMKLAHKILDKVEENNIITAVGFQCRYCDFNDAAREYIAKHPIVNVAASRIEGIPQVPWWRIKAQSGGQLVEQTIHQMDILRYFLGEPESVYSVARRGIITEADCKNFDTDDMSTTLITFKSGVVATMVTGCYSKKAASWDAKMTFGSVDSRMDYHLCSRINLYGVEDEELVETSAGGIIAGDGMQARKEHEDSLVVRNTVDFGTICDRTFIDAVITGDASKIRSPYRDAIKSVGFTLACNESMETGLPVKLDY